MILDRIQDLSALPDMLKERAAELKTQRAEATRWVRRSLYDARTKGELGLWDLHLQTLERAGELLDRATGVAALDRGVHTARNLLQGFERATTAPPIPEYDERNVREVMDAIRELDHLGLLRVERYERQHKNRKTVLDAITRETERRGRLAEFSG